MGIATMVRIPVMRVVFVDIKKFKTRPTSLDVNIVFIMKIQYYRSKRFIQAFP